MDSSINSCTNRNRFPTISSVKRRGPRVSSWPRICPNSIKCFKCHRVCRPQSCWFGWNGTYEDCQIYPNSTLKELTTACGSKLQIPGLSMSVLSPRSGPTIFAIHIRISCQKHKAEEKGNEGRETCQINRVLIKKKHLQAWDWHFASHPPV